MNLRTILPAFLLVGLLMVPSALSISATAFFAGWRLAQQAPTNHDSGLGHIHRLGAADRAGG